MNYQVICTQKIKPYVSVYGTRENDSFCITRFRTNTKSMRDYGTPLMETLPLVELYKHLKSATS